MDKITLVSDFLEKPSVALVIELIVIIAAINLLSVGVLNVDYISRLSEGYTKYVFILIGVCGLILLYKRALALKATIM